MMSDFQWHHAFFEISLTSYAVWYIVLIGINPNKK